VGLFFGMETSISQTEMDMMIPHFNFGRGVKEMNDIRNVIGFGYDFGHNFRNTSFGISGFYNMNNYSFVKEELHIYRYGDGMMDLPIHNKSRVTTYGVKFRYSPREMMFSRLSPYFEVGGGFATHTGVWRSNGLSILVDNSDPECPKYDYLLRDRGLLYRNTTLIGVGEFGLKYRLTGKYSTPDLMRFNNTTTGWYISASVRWEYGGNVTYTNAKHNPNHFYYNSGLGDQYDRPFMANPGNPDRSFLSENRHNMLVFQFSLIKALF
jgi:hypothetical protein